MTALDPDVADEIDEIEAMGIPEWHAMSVAAARTVEDELFSTDVEIPVGGVTDLGVEGPAGDVPIRVYRPAETPAPVLVFYHGGGWCLGTLDSADGLCRRLCRRTGAVIVSVDYRLAPEHPFPAAVEDALAAVRWADDHADAIGGDGRLGVAGSSAGGTLAAAVGLASARDHGPLGPSFDATLSVQALLYPATAPRFDTPSYRDNADGPLLTRADMRWFWDHYLRSPVDARNPLAAPMLATTVSATPPAVVATAGHDPLRDDGATYAARLSDAGVAVDYLEFGSLPHGFLSYAGDADAGGVPAADEAFDDVAAAIRERFDAAGDAADEESGENDT